MPSILPTLFTWTADGLAYVARSGGGWSTEEIVDDNADTYASLAVDSQGTPNVVYRSVAGGDLGNIVHAYRAGADDWIQEDVERVVDGQSPSLFIDGEDVIHVVYVDVTNSNLKYARRDGGAWNKTTIDATVTIPSQPRLFVDGDGNPHVVYVDENDEDLRYAYLCP